MKQRLFQLGIAVIFIAIAGIAAKGFIKKRTGQIIPIKSMDSWQQADAPLGFKINDQVPPFDSRFIQLTAFERARIPTLTKTSEAMGTEHGALTYNAQPFWSDNTQRGGNHTGDDINGIGGMNTDLGDPVYAIGNGLVVYRGLPAPGWGNTLVLAHRTIQGDIKLSMYAHLKNIHSAYGDLVYRGESIGTVGTANLRYPAHLHLEMLESSGVYIGHGYTKSTGNHINPSVTIADLKRSHEANLHISPLAVALSEKLSQQHDGITLQSQNNTK